MLARLLTLTTVMLLALAGQAATEIFMRVEGIPGESTDARHQNEIVLTSYDFSFMQPAAPPGARAAGRPTIAPFAVTKFVDAASPRLALASLNGQHLQQVSITVRRAGQAQTEFLRYTLSDVMISSFAQENDGEGTAPMETVEMTFSAIEMEYIPQRADGSAGTPVRIRWDVQRNAGG